MANDILIVDDEQDIRELVSGILTDEGHQTRVASDGISALAQIKQRQPSLVILDVWLGNSDRDGLKILETITRDHPFVPVIMISGHATVEMAVAAIKKGAYDFLEKPFDSERLLLLIERALETTQLKRENAALKKITGKAQLLGEHSSIQTMHQKIQKVAAGNSRVMITGASGVGKEVVARTIHQLSKRRNHPFVILNCITSHSDRLEADLFGVEVLGLDRSIPRKIGALEQAHGGILFLDEVAALPLTIQAKLVRFLQDHAFTRMGDQQRIEVDVRVMSASTVDLQQAMKSGKMREDLFYRLNVVPLHLPTLKERATDIPLMVEYFMQQCSQQHGLPPRRLSEEAMISLQAYAWPGNVRQLKNVVEWLLIMAGGDVGDPITPEMLPSQIRHEFSAHHLNNPGVVVMPLREAREAFEREYLLAQVNRFGGNISRTARFVGMERSALHRKLRTLGVYDAKDMETEETPTETDTNSETVIA